MGSVKGAESEYVDVHSELPEIKYQAVHLKRGHRWTLCNKCEKKNCTFEIF